MKAMDRVSRGKGFRGVLDYLLEKDGGRVIGGTAASTEARWLAREFGATRQLRPDIERPVWHQSLRLPPGEDVDDERWAEIAERYLAELGWDLEKTLYVVVKHKPDHIHLVASRIYLDGTLYYGRNENLKSTRITQQLEREFGLTITKGPEEGSAAKRPKKAEIGQAKRTGEAPARLRLQKILDEVLAGGGPVSVTDFIEELEAAGVVVRPNLSTTTGRLHGFAFHLAGHLNAQGEPIWFKGSQLGKRYTWAGLQERGVEYVRDRDFKTASQARDRAGAAADQVGGRGQGGPGPKPGTDSRGDGDSKRKQREDTEAVPGTVSGGGGSGPSDLYCGEGSGLGAAGPLVGDRPRVWIGAGNSVGDLATGSLLETGRDPGDGAVAAHIRVKQDLWLRQAGALGAEEYRITLVPRREGRKPFNPGKKNGTERFWTAEEVAAKIPFLSAKNIQGYDVYVTPMDPGFHYLVLDDTTLEALDELKRAGARPALIQETSPGNWQAVFRVPRDPDFEDEQRAANRVVRRLNRRYGDPKFSGVTHPFRIAGFGNAKPGKEGPDGRRFFVRIMEASGEDCPLATRALEEERWRLADERKRAAAVAIPPPRRDAPPAPVDGGHHHTPWEAERHRQRALAERLVREGTWKALDESTVDFRTAQELLGRGYAVEEVMRWMLVDPSVQERHGHALDDYVRRTVEAAARGRKPAKRPFLER